MRVAAERLRADIALAGAGPMRGPFEGGLGGYLAPIVPGRLGARSADLPMTAAADRITLVYVPEGVWPIVLSAPMAGSTGPLVIDASAPGCPTAGLCGFSVGTRALVVDTTAAGDGHEFFTVTNTAAGLAHDGVNPAFARPYAAGVWYVMPIVQRTYYFDRSGRRLMVYDGYQSEMPFIDNVLDVRFTYYADGSPWSVPRPQGALGNCVYDARMPPVPRLDERDSLASLNTTDMTDGPVCGDGAHAFDGDLLRIRLVRVTLRLQAASDDVRGAGELFARPGRSSSGDSYVPDFEVTFDVVPRNLTPMVFPH